MEERKEPVLLDADVGGTVGAGEYADISFLRRAREAERAPSVLLRITAVLSAVALVCFSLKFNLPEKASLAYAAGAALGSFLVPGLAVAIAALWGDGPNRRRGLRVFAGVSLILLVGSVINVVVDRGYAKRWLNKSNMTADDFRELAVNCRRLADLQCQEDNWRDFARLVPDDAVGAANLGIVLNHRGKHEEAVVQFRHAQDLGVGTYDLFAYMADSYDKLGRTSDAIEWSYKALSVAPRLVDVRGKLASLLVKSQRPYEALSLLQGYDNQLEANGQSPYFMGQRISVETVIDRERGGQAAEGRALRLPAYAGHFFVPVTIGEIKPKPFLVDTGASVTSLSEALLAESKAAYRILDSRTPMRTADGRQVIAKTVVVDVLRVGPFELRQVPAVVCAQCVSLLGQASLANFDMRTVRAQGVDFLLLAPR